MPAELTPYPAYKPSAVPWLGDVPEHWEVRRLRTVANVLNGATPSTNVPAYWDGEILWVTPEDLGKLSGRYIRASGRRISSDGYRSCGTTLAPAWSVAISTRAPIGHLGILTSDGCVNQGCRLLVPCPNVESEYLHYALSASREDLAALGQGSTFTELSRVHLASSSIPLPPLPEQTAIVRYLDHVDRRIRRYVSAKRKLIALLAEERQAVVSRAVTRGLDPSVALKPSGVPWLGDVPEHWEVRRLKTLARIRYGLGQPPPELSDGRPLIRATNIARGIISKKDLIFVDPKGIPPSRDATLQPKEIIVVRSGAYTADSAIIPEEYAGAISGYDMVVTANSALPEFIALGLLSTYVRDNQLIVVSSRAAQPHLNAEELGHAVCLVPPSSEQWLIVRHVQSATAKIDAAIARARRQVELVEEYRTRLIADVVTGKLDVREAAAQLPDEGDDREPVEENVAFVEGVNGAGHDTEESLEELATEREVTV